MSILPVLDVRQGMVVHAVAGRRAEYRPLQSPWSNSSDPGEVADGLRRRFGFAEVYVADLGAILDAQPDLTAWESIAAAGWQRMWIDAGLGDCSSAAQLQRHAARLPLDVHWIVGLESVDDPSQLAGLSQQLGPAAVFSLDLSAGRPLTTVPLWRHATPVDLVDEARRAGFSNVLVLDLTAVGGQQGPATAPLCRALSGRFPDLELWSGGGVRSPQDARQLLAAGCTKVLAATALHASDWPVQLC